MVQAIINVTFCHLDESLRPPCRESAIDVSVASEHSANVTAHSSKRTIPLSVPPFAHTKAHPRE